MGLEVRGISAVSSMLSNQHKKTNPRALDAMRGGAKEILELAKKQAPVDEGNLEDALELQEDRFGLNTRTRITIFVNESKALPHRPDKTVGDYATRMHDGQYNLGKDSLAKQRANGQVVGPKYLERAVQKLEKEIIQSVMLAIKGSL